MSSLFGRSVGVCLLDSHGLRIANVMLQSGSTVPEWVLKLPRPSKMKRRAMGKVQRGEAVTKDDGIGRREANRKR